MEISNITSKITGPDRPASSGMAYSSATNRPALVKLVLVSISHQPFGILMSQVHNIIRPGQQGLKLLQKPDPVTGREWGEIEYRGQPLRVIELARMLQMPLTEPIEHSQIFLSGRFQANGTFTQPFGVACDDILSATSTFSLDELRSLPGWLFYKRIGRLIWGAALVDKKILEEQPQLAGVPSPVLAVAGATSPQLDLSETALPMLPAYNQINLSNRETKPKEEQRPVMLLDLEVVRRRVFGE